MGTPAFYWSAARQTYTSGDYLKTVDNLGQLTKGENEFTARALPWRLVLIAGMAQGYTDLAEHFEFGARAKRDNPTPFRKRVSAYRTNSGQLALEFAQSFQIFQQKNADPKVELAFTYPIGNSQLVPSLKRVSSGIVVPDAEADDIERQTIQRGVLMTTCRAVGAPEDTAKAQQVFKADPVQVDRPVFLLAMANSLYEQSKVFARDKLDRPDRAELLCKQALDALKGVPETKESKALVAKIQKDLKKKS